MSIILTDLESPARPAARPRATGQGVAMANQSPVRVSTEPLSRRENSQLTGAAWRNVCYQVSAWEANVPYVDAALMRMADYRGAVTPYANTLDADWNREVNQWLDQTFYHDTAFDASGKFTFEEFQKQMWRYRDGDGDVLCVQVNDSTNRGRPQWRMIPALGIDSPGIGNANDWIDGVRVGLHHRALAYHVLAEESAVGWRAPMNRAGYVVDRANAFHFANWRKVGRSRGTTVFLSSGATVVDLAMLDSSLHRIFNLASKVGITFETAADTGKGSLKLLEGGAVDDTVPHPDGELDADGNVIDVQRYKELFMGDGPVVLDLDPGKTAKMHGTERDLPDVSAVRAADLERIAMAYGGLPVQVLFCIYSGAFNITGPGFRVALSSAVRWREGQLRKIEPWVRRAYDLHVQWGLRTKQIPYPRRDFRTSLCATRWEKVVGIDEGRDAKLDLIRLQIGATDEAEIAHEYGRNLEDVVATRARFIRSVCEEFGWSPDPSMWASAWSSQQPAAPAA